MVATSTDGVAHASTSATSAPTAAVIGETESNSPVVSGPQAGLSVSHFVTIDDPDGDQSSATGINDSATIVGTSHEDYQDTGWKYNGTFSEISHGGDERDTDLTGINDSGAVTGFDPPGFLVSGFGFVDDGKGFTKTDLSPHISTVDNGINNNGVVVGASFLHTVSGVTPVSTGFIDDGGTITYLNVPGTLTSNGYTSASGINDAGDIVGSYMTSYASGQQHGFLDHDGAFTTIDDPNAGWKGTVATGINDAGIIVGYYYDHAGVSHGFIDINGTFETVNDPVGSNGTQINGINNAGQIVGDYYDSHNVEHGFVASINGVATAEDRALTLTSLGVGDASGNDPIVVTLGAGHGNLTLSDTDGVQVSGQGTDDLSLTGTASAIGTALAAGVIYAPTLNYAYADVLTVTAADQGHDPSSSEFVGVVISPQHTITNGSTYEVTGASADTFAFAGPTGTLKIDNPGSFTGEIAGSFKIGDVIDLAGFSSHDTAATGADSYKSATDETTLTVKDIGGHVVETFMLAGDQSKSTWTVSSDHHGGIDIADPPADTASSGGTLTLFDQPPATADGTTGTPPGTAGNEPNVHNSLTKIYNALTGDLGSTPPSATPSTVSGQGGDTFVFNQNVSDPSHTTANTSQLDPSHVTTAGTISSFAPTMPEIHPDFTADPGLHVAIDTPNPMDQFHQTVAGVALVH